MVIKNDIYIRIFYSRIVEVVNKCSIYQAYIVRIIAIVRRSKPRQRDNGKKRIRTKVQE